MGTLTARHHRCCTLRSTKQKQIWKLTTFSFASLRCSSSKQIEQVNPKIHYLRTTIYQFQTRSLWPLVNLSRTPYAPLILISPRQLNSLVENNRCTTIWTIQTLREVKPLLEQNNGQQFTIVTTTMMSLNQNHQKYFVKLTPLVLFTQQSVRTVKVTRLAQLMGLSLK